MSDPDGWVDRKLEIGWVMFVGECVEVQVVWMNEKVGTSLAI